jgi:hypothetical protein
MLSEVYMHRENRELVIFINQFYLMKQLNKIYGGNSTICLVLHHKKFK